MLAHLKGFKFVTTLILLFKKIESEDKTSSNAEIIVNKSDIHDVFQLIYTQIYQTYKNL